MSLDAAQHLLDEFNDGNWDEVGPYFNDDFELFLNYLAKYELDHELDYESVDEEFKNQILLKNLKTDKETALKYICNNLVTDVHIESDGFYMFLRDREELAELFDKGYRDDSSHYAAKAVLGEDYWEPYYETTYNVYSDVIEELDESNLQHLSSYIIREIGNQDLSLEEYESDFFTNLQKNKIEKIIFK